VQWTSEINRSWLVCSIGRGCLVGMLRSHLPKQSFSLACSPAHRWIRRLRRTWSNHSWYSWYCSAAAGVWTVESMQSLRNRERKKCAGYVWSCWCDASSQTMAWDDLLSVCDKTSIVPLKRYAILAIHYIPTSLRRAVVFRYLKNSKQSSEAE